MTERTTMRTFVLAAAAAVLALAVVAGAAAEPSLRVEPRAADCHQFKFIRAAGMEPSTEVVVELSWNGKSPGSVAGMSDAEGNFASPIPHALIPCAAGGTVTARITKGGPPLVTQFEVLLPQPTPTAMSTAAPEPPVVGTGDAGRPNLDERLILVATGAGLLLLAVALAAVRPGAARGRD